MRQVLFEGQLRNAQDVHRGAMFTPSSLESFRGDVLLLALHRGRENGVAYLEGGVGCGLGLGLVARLVGCGVQ